MSELPPEIRRHYEAVDEDARLRGGLQELELVRTRELLRARLPAGRLRILDVGGATGVHAEWLVADGHTVHLIDPVPGHVEEARRRLGTNGRFSAEIGDARYLPGDAAAWDAVLLMGPLYHLVDRSDRLRSWREAARVVRPGGLIAAAAISRFASLIDGLASEYLFDGAFRRIVEADLASGLHRNPTDDPRWFTTAYLHRPDELAAEAAECGLVFEETVGVEGVGAWLFGLAARWENAADRESILFAARATEAEPSMIGASPHLLAFARRPPSAP